MELAGIVVAVLALVVAGWQAWNSRQTKAGAARAEQSAAAAELRAGEALDLARRQAEAIEAIANPKPPAVEWRLTHKQGVIWVLRNTGTDTAFDVRTATAYDLMRNHPMGQDIPSRGSVEIQILTSAQVQVPNELELTWADAEGNASRELVPFEK